ncbi:MAG: AAA family ATPase [Acidimicrobiales bacterium]|nr:AAA family ATPase [Acidimicrobiales bacterium]
MSVAPAPLVDPWPLTGRHEVLEVVCDALGQGAPVVFVHGEAGTGKTRLGGEALRRLEAEGWSVSRATATASARGVPLGALAHLVPSPVDDRPQELFNATRRAIEDDAAGRPALVAVDDAQHLDPTSATLLVSLVQAGVVQVLATMRSGERAPDAVGALWSLDAARTVTLRDLGPLEVDALLHRVLGGPLDGVARATLLDASGGNPLYLRELVLGAVDAGTLAAESGVWRLTGPLALSPVLGAQVLERVAHLAAEAREALELVAVGEALGLALLERLATADALEELEARALIEVTEDRRRVVVRPAHPMYGEAVRASLGTVRLRRLSRRIAEALAATGTRRRGDAALLARFQIAGGVAPDAEALAAGARMARHHQDWSTAVRLGRAALDAGDRDAAALVIEAHSALGEFGEADALAAAVLADPDGLSEAARVEVHRSRADSLFFAHDDAAGAVDQLEAALDGVVDPVRRDLLRFSRAAMLAWSGRFAEAREAIAGLIDSDEPRVAVQAAMVAEFDAAVAGPAGRAIDLADQWFGVHLSLPDLAGTNAPGLHLVLKTVALANAGRLAEAADLADLGYRASIADRNLAGQLWFSLELGRVALLRGDAEAAIGWFREQVALCRSTGLRRPVTLGLSGLAVAHAYRGDAAAAAAAIAERDATGLGVVEAFAVEGVRGEAWAAAAAGDPARARALLVAGATAAEASGAVLLAAFARLDALRLGDRDQAEPLARAAAVAGSTIVDLAARWAASPRDGAELDAVADGFEQLGCRLVAAEVHAAAATAWRAAGHPKRATAAEGRADALARRLRGADTPGLTVVEAVVPLTPREREVALLVADGLTSKEVAERLFLSARTVSNHLQNAYTKLGISKRTELGEALRRFGDGADR